MEKIRVGVLFGGRSSEHSISCISANSIINVIDREKYEVIPIGITKDNSWVIFSDKTPFLTLSKTELPEVTKEGIQDNKPAIFSKSPTGNPAAFNKALEVVLSIPIDELKTPAPTKAMACKSISP